MRKILLVLLIAVWSLGGCSKPATPVGSSNSPAASDPTPSSPKSNDAVQQKLVEYSGGGTDCGRLDVQAADAQLKSASSCAMQAAQNKQAFYIAYDMPGMSVGVAGNSEGKLFTVQSQGGNGLTSGACPSQLRVASSGRISCFAPGDMGSMGSGHGSLAMPKAGMSNPHATGDAKQPK